MRYIGVAAAIVVTLGNRVPTAQSTAGPPAFEAVSIKPSTGATPVTIRQLPDGGLTATNFPLRPLIDDAYPSEATTIVNLPGWLNDERYDIIIRPPAATPREQLPLMLRALLRDRMKLAAHYEPREEASYDLVVARADGRLGPELKPASVPCPEPPVPFPMADVKRHCSWVMAQQRLSAGGITMAELASRLRIIGRIVRDKTGLAGYYELELRYSTETQTAADPDAPPALVTAVREQLGLELKPARVLVDTLVIDHVERPTEN